ncbi:MULTISPECIES: class I SAM-dependent methyltransferase [Streptomyces]|uniref:class I SAM-dependent methyltransferase n=1 Tax=Streptomyces TaxID=1883 RepID=UPI001F40A88B|nr:class I SAM-dependent methyltransferase [Streptomyces sp. SID685]
MGADGDLLRSAARTRRRAKLHLCDGRLDQFDAEDREARQAAEHASITHRHRAVATGGAVRWEPSLLFRPSTGGGDRHTRYATEGGPSLTPLDPITSRRPAAEAASGYDAGAFSHHMTGEQGRLRALEKLWDPFTEHSLRRAGVPAAARCLEVGAGAGSVARMLARICPGGHVTATDIDTRFFAELAAEERVTVLSHDVTQDGFPAGSFEVVHARMVLCHLSCPERVLAAMSQWLVPGGLLLVEDLDLAPADASPHPVMRRGLHVAEQTLEASQGSDLRLGRRLQALVTDAGFDLGGMAVQPVLIGDGGPADEFWRLSFAQLHEFQARNSSPLAGELDAAMSLIDRPDFTDIGMHAVSVWGRKPGGPLSDPSA